MTGAADSNLAVVGDTGTPEEGLAERMAALGRAAKAASAELALAGAEVKARALNAAAAAIRARQAEILEANGRDMAGGRASGLSAALLDRLELTPARIEAMAAGLELPMAVGAGPSQG